jgi:hypothetical protein
MYDEFLVHGVIISVVVGLGLGFLIGLIVKWPRNWIGTVIAAVLSIPVFLLFGGPSCRIVDVSGPIVYCNFFLGALVLGFPASFVFRRYFVHRPVGQK